MELPHIGYQAGLINTSIMCFSASVSFGAGALLLGTGIYAIKRTESTRMLAFAKARPDYYITSTRDFTQYTKDSEEKYWRKETKFDWQQSVHNNLEQHLENLDAGDFLKVTFNVIPMLIKTLELRLLQIQREHLPLEEDALKDIAECVPSDRNAIQQAISIQSTLKSYQLSVSKKRDQLEILSNDFLDLSEQNRLGLVREGAMVKHLESETEREKQTLKLSQLTDEIKRIQKEINELEAQSKIESERLTTKIRSKVKSIESQVLVDLEASREMLQMVLLSKNLPKDPKDLSRLKNLILKRQLRGLKDICNHALVVEQSAIAPLTLGIIHYKRHREIQEAMTTFINDEAKHSATFRRYLAEKLEAREYISAKLIKGAEHYMWLARLMPGAGMFLAVMVEAIGAAFLELFGNEDYMPDRLFCSICHTISNQDEKRHMDLCVAIYNELYWKGNRWERIRNNVALKVIMKSVYGDKTEDHPLIQAFRAFGVDSNTLYNHIAGRLSKQLVRINMYIEPERLLEFIDNK